MNIPYLCVFIVYLHLNHSVLLRNGGDWDHCVTFSPKLYVCVCCMGFRYVHVRIFVSVSANGSVMMCVGLCAMRRSAFPLEEKKLSAARCSPAAPAAHCPRHPSSTPNLWMPTHTARSSPARPCLAPTAMEKSDPKPWLNYLRRPSFEPGVQRLDGVDMIYFHYSHYIHAYSTYFNTEYCIHPRDCWCSI